LYFHDVGFPNRVPFDKIKLSLPGRIVNEINMRSAAVFEHQQMLGLTPLAYLRPLPGVDEPFGGRCSVAYFNFIDFFIV